MELKLKNPRQIFLLVIAIGIALGTLIIGSGLFKITRQKVMQLAQQTEYEQKRNKILEHIQFIQAEVDRYQKHLPPALDTLWLMNHVTELARAAEISVSSIQPEMDAPSEKFQKMAVRLVAACQYHQLGNFVESLENSEPFLRIGEMTLEKVMTQSSEDTSQTMTGKGRVEMVIDTFLLANQ